MEKDIIVELFKRSVEKNKLIYATFIGDGDSSVYKALLELDPYKEFNIVIEKKECINHLYRNMSKKLRDIGKNKKDKKISEEKNLVEKSGLPFRDAIEEQVKYRQQCVEKNGDLNIQTNYLIDDILNVSYHVFGDHTKYSDFCEKKSDESEINFVPSLEKAGLFHPVQEVMNYYSTFADSFMYHATSNESESFNGIICKEINGKGINHSQTLLKNLT